MKIRYDKSTDSAYLALKKGVYSHSKKITDEIVVDVDKKGVAIGIEILEASKTISDFQPNSSKVIISPGVSI
jgi:uncharacterized protein YuzE